MSDRTPVAPRVQFVPEEVWLPGSPPFSAKPGVHRVASARWEKDGRGEVVCTCGFVMLGMNVDTQFWSHRSRAGVNSPSGR